MAGAVSHPPIFSVAMCRDWITSRPDEQHRELIAGVPVMMAPLTAAHQRIVTNLEVLLDDALAAHDASLEAYHDVGVNVVSEIAYDPEPDVVVDLRTAEGWQSRLLHAADQLVLPAFGLRCPVEDLYRRTAVR